MHRAPRPHRSRPETSSCVGRNAKEPENPSEEERPETTFAKAMVKTPSRTKGGRGKRLLGDAMDDSTVMPPPPTPIVARKKHSASRTRLSTSTSRDSLTTSGSTSVQQVQQMEEGSRSSTTTTTKSKEITMAALSEIATKVYPDIPSVMNVPLMQKIREIMSQEKLN